MTTASRKITPCRRTGHRRASLELIAALFLLAAPAVAAACQIEYSDFLINVFRQQGMHLDKRIGNYANLAECESTMRQAVSQSGDPNLANHMRCVGCSQPAVAPAPAVSPPTSAQQPAQGAQGDSMYDPEAAGAREKARQEAFEREHRHLLQTLKGEGRSASELKLKSSGPTVSELQLKGATLPPLHPSRPAAHDQTAEEVAAAQKRIAELKREVSGIQTLLRQYNKSLANNASEFSKWGETVDESYNSVLSESKEYVLGLFLEHNLLGNLKKIRKESFDKLGRMAASTDPQIRNWLRRELGGRGVDFERFEKLVKLGQAEGDFAGLLATDEGMRSHLDAVLLVNDLLGIVEQGVPDEGAFQTAKMIGSTYADLAAISYSWFAINRLGNDTEKLSREVASLSFRMRQAMKEMDCIDTCVATPGEGCLDRCSGRTRFTTPPPPLP